jgi:SAM-dependent methyltransferase
MIDGLYRHPEYYDIAFTWDLAPEIEFLARVFSEHVPFPVQRILEPACGTGRFLLALPKHGYDVTGYDRSPQMLSYARRRIAEAGDPDRARAVPGEMATARFDRAFDAALNSINSLGYLRTDDDVVAHLAGTGRSLRVGGVYVVHISCALEGLPDNGRNVWRSERDGVSVRTAWTIEHEDRAARLSHQLCTMEIEDHGRTFTLVDRYVLRLWIYDEFLSLVRASEALEPLALYSEDMKPLPLETRVTGEMGNLYHVLRAI